MNKKAGTPGLIVLLALAACSGGDDPQTAAEVASVIHRGNGGEPGSLDPAFAEDIHAFNVLADLYEGLVALSASGELIPGVAESWSVSEDGLRYEFALRRGARWSNGQPVTAGHFVNAWRRVTDSASTSTYAFLLEPVADMVAVDAMSLRIDLHEPAPHLLSVLTMPVAYPVPTTARAGFSSPESFVGNGAYVLVERTPGGAIRLRRSANYWDTESVSIDEVVYLPVADPLAEMNLFRAGELDVTNTIPPGHLRSLEREEPASVRIAPSLALYYLAFDLTEAPFDNVALRQALSMAIDRQQLVALIGRGEQPAHGIVPPGVAGYAPARFDWAGLPDAARVRRAQELYSEAGYGPLSPLAVTYTYDAEDIHEKIALAVAAMWREVLGVDVALDKKEWQYFLDTREQRDEWQVMRFAWFGDYNHPSTFTNIFRSDDPQNLPRYSNPEYDRLVESSPGDSAAEALLLREHPVAPLYFYVSKHLVNPQLGGFEDNVLDRHPSKYLFYPDQ